MSKAVTEEHTHRAEIPSSQDRLAKLAESANETARMVRVNVSLTLIVALYLALTLLSATDENIFLNSVVFLPQFETGITLKQSYLFAPIVFLYLHVQTLFLLFVLVRKVRRFNNSLLHMFPDNGMIRAEFSDWLSAVSLVQGLQDTGSFAAGAKFLAWIGTVGSPLLLLFLIDISSLRYQSMAMSLVHHTCVTVDLAGVWFFWRYVSVNRSIDESETRQKFFEFLTMVRLRTAKVCWFVLFVFLWAFAWPKDYHKEYEESVVDGQVLSPEIEGESLWEKVTKFNPFDDVFCKYLAWRGFCRTLDLRNVTLVQSRSVGELLVIPEKEDDLYRSVHGFDLSKRSLRFADMSTAYIYAFRLAETDLRGANLQGAELNRSDLRGAKLQGVDLSNVALSDADLRGAEFTDAILQYVEMSGANLQEVDLSGMDMKRADLTGATLWNSNLSDADLTDADLTGADLWRADLSDADLTDADLTGADLWRADLRRTHLTDADLTDADLRRTHLTNADLTDADLRRADLGVLT